MYAVIFRAKVAKLDEEYFRVAERLKELALRKYACVKFVSVTEGSEEIAISYWESLQHIHTWKNDPEHKNAQLNGRDKWYESYSVEICEVIIER